jgi:hypothetical protein
MPPADKAATYLVVNTTYRSVYFSAFNFHSGTECDEATLNIANIT